MKPNVRAASAIKNYVILFASLCAFTLSVPKVLVYVVQSRRQSQIKISGLRLQIHCFKMPPKINAMKVLQGQKVAMYENFKQKNLVRNATCAHIQGKITANNDPVMLYLISVIISAVVTKIQSLKI